MSRALVSVMLFVMIVSSTFLTIGIGTQNTYPIPFLSIVDIVSMDSNASPQHLFATYVAGRIVEMNASQLPFLQNIDPRYLHALIYDGKEFIEIPMRIYTKVIHFNPGSLLSGKLYVVPKKMSSNTVIDIKLPPIYPKPLDEEALSRLPTYLRGAILYPTTIAIRLENGKELRIPIIFAIAKVRNIEVTKNSIDYDRIVEDFELYGVEGFYRHLLELSKQSVSMDLRKLVDEYVSSVLRVVVENVGRSIQVSGSVEEWNVVEFLVPFKSWSIECVEYPCRVRPWFEYLPKHPYPGTVTELIVYRIEVYPYVSNRIEESRGSQFCNLVVRYYVDGYGWVEREYLVDPSSRNVIWFEWYFPGASDNVSRVDVVLEECFRPLILRIDSVTVAHFMPNVESSALSNKTLDLYPLGTPSTRYYVASSNVPIYVGSKEFIVLETVLPVPTFQALLEKFVSGNKFVDRYVVRFSFEIHPLNRISNAMDRAEIQVCIGTACSNVVDVDGMGFVELELYPQDILSYFETLRELPIVISIRNLCDEPIEVSVVEQVGIPIRMAARPMKMYYTAYGPPYLCTTTYPDTSSAWIASQFQVQGRYEASYIVRNAPLPNHVGGFVVRSSFLSQSEMVRGMGPATENLKIEFYYHAFGSEKPSLRSVAMDIHNPGLGSVTNVFIRVRGLMEGAYRLPRWRPLIPSLVLLSPKVSQSFKAFYENFEIVYNVWTEYIEYVSTSCRSYSIESNWIHVDFAPPLAYEGLAHNVSFEIEFVDATIFEQSRYRTFYVEQIIDVVHVLGWISSVVNATYVISLLPETPS